MKHIASFLALSAAFLGVARAGTDECPLPVEAAACTATANQTPSAHHHAVIREQAKEVEVPVAADYSTTLAATHPGADLRSALGYQPPHWLEGERSHAHPQA